MQKITTILLFTTLAFACGEPNEKTTSQTAAPENQPEIQAEKSLPGADYSSLFTDFSCNLTTAEVAQALNVPESDVSIPKYKKPVGCSFVINGFGKNGLGDETIIEWFPEKASKAAVKKEIANYQDLQATNSSLGMGIVKSETGDTYFATSPKYGRVIVLNENYDNWLLISYAPKHEYKTRTEGQHAALGTKMIDLANYLLRKNKK